MFQPRTFVVPLYGGDYQQRIALAEQKVTEAEKRVKDGKTLPRLMGETESEVDALVREHNNLVAEAEADGCTRVTIKALGRKQWNELVREHPPRTGDDALESARKGDAAIGVNEETFSEALLAVSIVEVSDGTPVPDLLDAVSSAQFDLLFGRAFYENRAEDRAPKALTSSLSTDVTATSPAASD